MIPSLQGTFGHNDATHHCVSCVSDVCQHKDHEGSHAEAMHKDHHPEAGEQDHHPQSMMDHSDMHQNILAFACNCQKGQGFEMMLSLKYQWIGSDDSIQYPREEDPVGLLPNLKTDPSLGNIFRPPIILS